jgi:hypothetical protein
MRDESTAKNQQFSLDEISRITYGENLAETEGFEPSIRCNTYDDLANRCLQPLGHVSGVGAFAVI